MSPSQSSRAGVTRSNAIVPLLAQVDAVERLDAALGDGVVQSEGRAPVVDTRSWRRRDARSGRVPQRGHEVSDRLRVVDEDDHPKRVALDETVERNQHA